MKPRGGDHCEGSEVSIWNESEASHVARVRGGGETHDADEMSST